MINGDRFVLNLDSKKLLIVIISLQLAFLGLIALDGLGLGIPILRQVIDFIYLTFVPGILLLGVFRINNLNTLETLLYSVGLSLSFLMFIGFLMNSFYPLIGISKPISVIPLTITISVATLVLCIILYYRNREFRLSLSSKGITFTTLLIALLPFISIFGDYLLYYNHTNILLLILFVTISMIPIFVALNKVPNENFNFIIWMVTLALVWYNSLYTPYIRLTDNLTEYYFCNKVIQNGFLNFSAPHHMDPMLGVTALLPEFAIMCNMNLTWIYKIIVPLISSFIPVGLYQLFKRVTSSNRIAFFSSFFFISMFVFFTWCSITMKMVSAGLFLMLLLLLMTNERVDLPKKRIIGVIFALSLVTSHYGTSYIFMFSIIFALFLLFLFKERKKVEQSNLITSNFVILYIVSAIAWYIYTAGGRLFEVIVSIGQHFMNSIFTEFISQEDYGIQILFGKFPLYLEILKVFYIISAFFIFVGLSKELYACTKGKLMNEYTALSLPSFFFLVLPYVPGIGQYGGGRAWYISSFLLAPFCMKGFLEVFKLSILLKTSLLKLLNEFTSEFKRLTILGKFFNPDLSAKKEMTIIGIFLCIFFLFNSGFVAEVVWKHNTGASNAISAPRILKDGAIEEKEYFYRTHLSVVDMKSAEWLIENMERDCKIFSGANAQNSLRINGLTLVHQHIGLSSIFPLSKGIKIPTNSYIYLSEFNVINRKIKVTPKLGVWGTFSNLFDINEISMLLDSSNKIYTNGDSEIYYR